MKLGFQIVPSYLLAYLLTFDLKDFDYSRALVSSFSLPLQFKTLPLTIVPIKRQVAVENI